jgi:ribonuclease BN (tRNA processing enzyme)
VFRGLVVWWGREDLIDNAFDVTEYEPWDQPQVGPFQLRFCEVPHFIRTFAVEITSRSGRRFTFGADCSPNDALVEFARDTDLLLIEGTLPRPERTGDRGHLTPSEAGAHGRAAGAKRLVVTHYSDELDSDWVSSEAAEAFGGPVELAHEDAVYTV